MATVSSYDQQPLRLSSTEPLDDGPDSAIWEPEFEGQLKTFLRHARGALRRIGENFADAGIRVDAGLLARQLRAGPARNFPCFVAINPDHTKQVDDRLVHLSRQDIPLADRQAETHDRMCRLPPS